MNNEQTAPFAARTVGEARNRIHAKWARLSSWPGGRWLFSRTIGAMAPYTGTIRARVLELAPGYARLEMRDRRRLRNHLRSLHAVALVNLAEETSGIAMLAGLPDEARAILTGLEIEYLKKARGTIRSECRCAIPDGTAEEKATLDVQLTDAEDHTVARARAYWLVRPR